MIFPHSRVFFAIFTVGVEAIVRRKVKKVYYQGI